MRVHPECLPECTHTLVPDRGGVFVTRPIEHDRMQSEAGLAEHFPGKTIEYHGICEGDVHTWRVGAKPYRPMRATAARTEGKTVKREIKTEHRPAVWEGNGPPGPVDFSRVPEVVEQPFPAPILTSDTDSVITPSQPAGALLALASGSGWAGVITHAHGHMPHATHGRPSAAAKKSEAVRLVRGNQRAVAVRMGGSWSSLWTWSSTQFFTRHATLEAFKNALAQPVDGPVDNRSDLLNSQRNIYEAAHASAEA